MGGGIAQVVALAGMDVVIADVNEETTRANYDRLITECGDFEAAGLFPDGSKDKLGAHLSIAASIEEAVATADFIEEAIYEVIEPKHETLRAICAAARPDAVIGSNTSTISITKLAQAVTNPGRFLGVHFSNPAPFIPGVELIPHPGTAPSTIAVAEAVVAATGKQSARLKDQTGFVLNRLQYALFTEACRLAEEGIATVEDIDTIARTTFGFRLPFFGPFAIADMAGLDVYQFCYENLGATFPDRFVAPNILSNLVAKGKLGTKAGAGFLNVPADRTPALIAYRNKAYARMQQLIDELGPAPLD
ncbi:MAG: 3-hydroxyacyl-CoA dehydrogenase family protein [Micrococcales bacterium]|nr:3-hydroxyacyl-CoA dehydrogenase family protein [Micrococcales bacterium]